MHHSKINLPFGLTVFLSLTVIVQPILCAMSDPSGTSAAQHLHPEPYHSLANRPYCIKQQCFKPNTNIKKYREKGIASWYGKPFHGRKTSTGEQYNMYSYTAASTSLPIPSYAKVTNLDNKKTIVVRINDRGPFIGNRIMDLSYGAATKLGFVDKGLANVQIDWITPEAIAKYMGQKNSSSQPHYSPKNLATTVRSLTYRNPQDYTRKAHSHAPVAHDYATPMPNHIHLRRIQIAYFKQSQLAKKCLSDFHKKHPKLPISIAPSSRGYSVLIGPLPEHYASTTLTQLQKDYTNAFIVTSGS